MCGKLCESLSVDSECIYLRVKLREELPEPLYLTLHMPSPCCLGNKRLSTIMQWQHPFSPATLCLERNICYLNRIITQGEKHGQYFSSKLCRVNLNATFLFVRDTNLISKFLMRKEKRDNKKKAYLEIYEHFIMLCLICI